jgi:alpha-N-acetylglucosaminidase
MKLLFICLVNCCISPIYAQLNIKEAEAFINRIIPERSNQFTVEPVEKKDNGDVFEIESREGKIILRGSSGVSIGSALNYYLQQYCHANISWDNRQVNLPASLPVVPAKVVKSSSYRYRYYLNYCTFNYTMLWWDWDRWEKEIDWMALNGINMPLALTGQDAIWQKVYKSMGFEEKELKKFFSGPAYSAFNWMGLLDDWNGPLPQRWIDAQKTLQEKILKRERSLGMTPILPAFNGHVPPAFKEKFPHATVNNVEWQGFSGAKMLDPNDPLFITIGEKFIKEQTKAFGTDHLYSADAFIEVRPPSSDPAYLTNMGRVMYGSMKAADPKAVWVMQGWMFHYVAKFWQTPQIKAFLGGVPDDNMIILDLYSESYPVWNRTEAYYGKPWIWCMLHNFGGNISLYGRMENVAKDLAMALSDPQSGKMSGIGLAMEGIEQNPALYALMVENTWRNTPIDVEQWMADYVIRRYGKANAYADSAWKILKNTVYKGNVASGGPESIITGRPTFAKSAKWTRTELFYDPTALIAAWHNMIKAIPDLKDNAGFQYDLADVTRQVLANYANVVQQKYAGAYKKNDLSGCTKYSIEFIELVNNMDRLLATRKDFLLGKWLEDARRWGKNKEEVRLYEKNARNIITLWGDSNSVLHDYANRQWSGLLTGFYKPRWEEFFRYVANCQQDNKAVDLKLFDEHIKRWEWEWVNKQEMYSKEPRGETIKIALELYDKYASVLSTAYSAETN